MMGGWNYGNMMNWGSGGWVWFNFLGLAFWILILVNLILFTIWFWKQIQKK